MHFFTIPTAYLLANLSAFIFYLLSDMLLGFLFNIINFLFGVFEKVRFHKQLYFIVDYKSAMKTRLVFTK